MVTSSSKVTSGGLSSGLETPDPSSDICGQGSGAMVEVERVSLNTPRRESSSVVSQSPVELSKALPSTPNSLNGPEITPTLSVVETPRHVRSSKTPKLSKIVENGTTSVLATPTKLVWMSKV